MDRFAVVIAQFVQRKSRQARHFLPVGLAPEAVVTRRHLRLLGAGQAHVDVTPADRRRDPRRFFKRQAPARVGDVHAAEVGHGVVDNEQLAVVAPVQDAQR